MYIYPGDETAKPDCKGRTSWSVHVFAVDGKGKLAARADIDDWLEFHSISVPGEMTGKYRGQRLESRFPRQDNAIRGAGPAAGSTLEGRTTGTRTAIAFIDRG